MGTTSIGWEGLAASLVLIGIALGISVMQRLRLEGTILWASLRAAAQLLAVGLLLVLLFDEDTPIAYAWFWVAGMVFFAAATIASRTKQVPGSFLLGLVAVAAVTVVSLGVVFGLGMFPLEVRALVPLAGMMIGNAMSESVLATNRVIGEIRDHRWEIEARLALGHTSRDAARPYLRAAVRTAVIPQIERTKAVGLVILPGAMTGLILAGVDPIDAVQVQLAVMYLVLGSVAVSVTVMAIGLSRRLFTADHRLVRLPEDRQTGR